MKLSELLTEVRAITQDDGTRWNDAEVVNYLNQGQRDFCHKTLCLRDKATVSLQVSGLVDLSGLNMIQVLRLEFNGKGLPFETEERLDLFTPSWGILTTPPSSAPTSAPAFKSYLYGLYGPNTLRLYPAPFASFVYATDGDRTAASLVAGDVGKLAYVTADKKLYRLTAAPGTWSEVTATLYYAKFPAALVEATPDQVPETLELYHMAPVYYAAHRAYLKDGQYRNPEKAAEYRALYEEQVAIAARDVGLMMDKAWRRGVTQIPMPAAQPQGA